MHTCTINIMRHESSTIWFCRTSGALQPNGYKPFELLRFLCVEEKLTIFPA